MSAAEDLLRTAELLVRHKTKRPRRSDLNRAVSTCYYRRAFAAFILFRER